MEWLFFLLPTAREGNVSEAFVILFTGGRGGRSLLPGGSGYTSDIDIVYLMIIILLTESLISVFGPPSPVDLETHLAWGSIR